MTERDALIAIKTTFILCNGELNNGGIELSEDEFNFIKKTIELALED